MRGVGFLPLLAVVGCAPKVVALPKPVVGAEVALPSKAAQGIAFAPGADRLSAVWVEPAGDSYELKFAGFDATKWSEAVVVSSAKVMASGGAKGPRLLARRDGSLTACWFEGETARIASSKDGGGTWTRAFSIQGGWKNASSLTFFENAKGLLVAAWVETVKRATTEPVEMALLADETSSFQKATAHGQQVCRDCGFSASSAADGGYLGFRHQSTQRATHQGESTIVLLRTDRAGHSEAIVEHEGWKIDGDSTRVASGPVVSTDGAHAITAWYSAVPKPNVIVMMSTDRGRTFRGWRVGADGPARDFTSSWSGGTATVAWVETGTDGTFLRAMRLGRNTVWGPGSLMEVESGTIPTLVSVSGATYLYRSGRDGRGTLVRLRTEPPDTPPEL